MRNRPSLLGYEWLWAAFVALGSCRQIGMGLGPIPWTATQRYAEVMRLSTDEAFLLHWVIPVVDAVLLEHQHQKTEKPRPKAAPSKGGRRG